MSTPAALLSLHAAVALFGFAGLFGKWIALPPTSIVLGRTVVAALALALVVARHRTNARPDRALAANGVILAIHWVSFFAAIQLSSVAIGLLGYASFPLFALLLEHAQRGGRWTRREIVASLLVVAGFVLIAPPLDGARYLWIGLALGLVSGATFAWLAVRGRRLVERRAPAVVALWQNAFAALALVPAVLLLAPVALPGARDVALIVVLGLACTALAHTLFIASLSTLTAHTASVVAALEPVYGIALALVLLGEWPAPATVAGGLAIVAAAVVAAPPLAPRRSGGGD